MSITISLWPNVLSLLTLTVPKLLIDWLPLIDSETDSRQRFSSGSQAYGSTARVARAGNAAETARRIRFKGARVRTVRRWRGLDMILSFPRAKRGCNSRTVQWRA